MRNKAAIEQFVTKAIQHFQFKLGLAHWNLKLKFKDLQEDGLDKVVEAKVESSWEYKEINVAVDSDVLAKHNTPKREIARTLAHELLHVKNGVGFEVAKWVFDKMVTVLDERNNADMEFSPIITEEIERLVG